jgi:GT2 family glycosyltransferase
MRFAVAVIHTRKFSGRYLDSMLGLVKPAGGFDFIRVPDLPVDEGREAAVELFMQGDADVLLQVDDDMILHPLTLERLASWEVDVVHALCATRTYPPVVGMYQRSRVEEGREVMEIERWQVLRWLLAHPEAMARRPVVLAPRPADALVPTRVCGAGCLLVRRRVFERVKRPWFKCSRPRHGEDFYFTNKARAAGFQPYIDRSVIVGHEWGSVCAMPRDWVVTMLGEWMLARLPHLLDGMGLWELVEQEEMQEAGG